MAPDRGAGDIYNESFSSGYDSDRELSDESDTSLLQQDNAQTSLADQTDQDQDFTVRGVAVGLVIGVLIAFSNAYFGLQTGWISGMVRKPGSDEFNHLADEGTGYAGCSDRVCFLQNDLEMSHAAIHSR